MTESHKFNSKIEGLYIINSRFIPVMKDCFNKQNSNSVIYNIATTKNKNHMIFSTDVVVKAFDSIQQAFITKNSTD